MRTTIILATMLFVPAVAFSDTITVPDDYPTIQQAIDAASDGDTVFVEAGTYVENIYFNKKAITVESADGPEATVIDGSQAGAVVFFPGGQSPDTLLEGFSITNGSGVTGGGILNYGEPRIRKNIISGNTSDYGGGITFWGAAVIEGNVVSGNTGMYGGGIYCKGATVIRNNIVADNVSTNIAGGIHCMGGTAEIMGNLITGNSTAAAWGGGIHCIQATANITGNMISGNSAKSGAGINCYDSTVTLTNNTVTDNTATSSIGEGGGIKCYNYSTVTAANMILWNNQAPEGPEIWVGGIGVSTLTIHHSDVKGGPSSAYVQSGDILNWGTGMSDLDPLFVNAAGGDYHLTFKSPCKDSGDNAAVIDPEDFEGDPRIAYGTTDMGADEFYTHLYYTGDANPGGAVELKFVALPGAFPVGFWIAFNAFETPIPGAYGDWWLLPPMIGPFDLGSIPVNGVYVLPGTIPAAPPGPYTLYLQAIIGTPLKLTNLCTMDVK